MDVNFAEYFLDFVYPVVTISALNINLVCSFSFWEVKIHTRTRTSTRRPSFSEQYK